MESLGGREGSRGGISSLHLLPVASLRDGVVKNISGVPVSKVEESLFLKGKKFCPVEKDPPIIRMQKELNNFYRNLRLEWIFYGQEDGRSELEKRFYPKSGWKPLKACVDIENFISRIQ